MGTNAVPRALLHVVNVLLECVYKVALTFQPLWEGKYTEQNKQTST